MATAESLTAGRIASRLGSVPGASAAFRGSVVAYASQVKVDVLGVPVDLVEQHGVVSAPCAIAMAEGAARLLGATYAVSTTGVAGPDEQEGKPVGTVFVAVAGPGGTTVTQLALSGDREQIVESTCDRALALVLIRLRATHPRVDG